MTQTAHVLGRAILVETLDEPPVLLIVLDIDCPVCGGFQAYRQKDGPLQVQVAGHHLRALRDLLVDFIEEHPDLVGRDEDTRTVSRRTYAITPENN
jgi:hypothetical protein